MLLTAFIGILILGQFLNSPIGSLLFSFSYFFFFPYLFFFFKQCLLREERFLWKQK